MPIIQSFAQLEQNYGKEGADVIIDNTQLTIFGGFAPNSTSAEVLSKSLGSRTVMSGSVSKSKNDPSQSLRHPIKFCVNNNPSSNNKTADCGVIRLSDLPRVNFSFLSAECYARFA